RPRARGRWSAAGGPARPSPRARRGGPHHRGSWNAQDIGVPMDVRSIAETIGSPAAALGILIESTGIPFPGELTLVAVAAYAGAGHLNIVIVIVLAAVGAVPGGALGYFIGR